MNQNKNRSVFSYKKRKKMAAFVFFAVICAVSVIYVSAAENREDTEETMARTSHGLFPYQEAAQIRMANEDGILSSRFLRPDSQLNEREYGILTRIVEAEATNMDAKSKILVANVVLNRMRDERFPDTVEEVVFQNVNGAVQFSPIADGRYYSVKVTESTKECVDRALAGEDYSEGALYFMERTMSSPSSVRWFDRALTKLFVYQGHEFYR